MDQMHTTKSTKFYASRNLIHVRTVKDHKTGHIIFGSTVH